MNLQSFAGECPHKEREIITSEAGDRLASRCVRCHNMRTFKACSQCKSEMLIPWEGTRRFYCTRKCKDKAYRLRVKADKQRREAAEAHAS